MPKIVPPGEDGREYVIEASEAELVELDALLRLGAELVIAGMRAYVAGDFRTARLAARASRAAVALADRGT